MNKYKKVSKKDQKIKAERKQEESRLYLNSELKNIEQDLENLKDLLLEMEYPIEKVNKKIDYIKKQLNIAKEIWDKILATDIIIKLAENDVFRKKEYIKKDN